MIKVKNWCKYQSYKDRKPPWIRFHRSTIDDYQFQMMSANARALLPMLWLLACEDEDPTSGRIKMSTTEIAFRLRQKETDVIATIKEIQVSGFIECNETVTKPLRDRSQTVPPETETETETETEKDMSPCPHFEIIDVYNKILNILPTVKPALWNGTRKKHLKARWDEDKERNNLKWWEDYFVKVKKTPFLTGENNRGWKADLGWLVNHSNMVKVLEGNYDNSQAKEKDQFEGAV